jgi:hypothetical protein
MADDRRRSLCLDMLRSRKSRHEETIEAPASQPIASHDADADPEKEALMADSVGLALLVVLETLAPAERLAFVLHDIFDMPFEEIAPIVERSPKLHGSLPAAPVAACREPLAFQTPAARASGRSLTPSSPHREAVNSRRFSECSTQTSYFESMPQPCLRANRPSSAARRL